MLEMISDARTSVEGKKSTFTLWVGVLAQRVVYCEDFSA
jgi:hypothetical protein